MARSDLYCSVVMGCVSLDCSSVSISLAACLRYVLVENFGEMISGGNKLIVIVSLVELMDVTNHL